MSQNFDLGPSFILCQKSGNLLLIFANNFLRFCENLIENKP